MFQNIYPDYWYSNQVEDCDKDDKQNSKCRQMDETLIGCVKYTSWNCSLCLLVRMLWWWWGRCWHHPFSWLDHLSITPTTPCVAMVLLNLSEWSGPAVCRVCAAILVKRQFVFFFPTTVWHLSFTTSGNFWVNLLDRWDAWLVLSCVESIAFHLNR